jgi:hypothetical protein
MFFTDTGTHDCNLERFLTLTSQNIGDGPKLNSLIYQRIKEIDNHWLLLVLGDTRHKDSQAVSSLITNGHYFFRACASLVFAGQPTPIYPLLRASLESCLYAVMITSKPELENVWLRRNKDDASKEACKKEFTANKTFRLLETQYTDLAKICRQFYDLYIDYGAHPNVNGTFTFIEPVRNGDQNSVVVNYLQGDGRETRIAAFTTIQLAEVAMHLAILAMPFRTAEYKTKEFLAEFSPKINPQVFGL